MPTIPTESTALRALLVLAIVLSIAVPAALPQEGVPAAPTLADGDDALLDQAALEARVKEVQASALPAADKDALQAAYQRALAALAEAKLHGERAAQFDKARLAAPDLVASLRAELAAPAEDATPAEPPGATTAEIEQLANQKDAERGAAATEVAKWQQEEAALSSRGEPLRQAAQGAREALAALESELGAAVPLETLSADFANRVRALAERRARQAELASYDAEARSLESRTEVARARREHAERRLAFADEAARRWRELAHARRLAEAEADAERARAAAMREAVQQNPIVKRLGEQNVAFAEERTQVAQRSDAASRELEELRAELEGLKLDFAATRRRVEAGGLSDVVGPYLHRQQSLKPRIRAHERALSDRAEENGRIVLRQIDLEEERRALGNPEAYLQRVLADGTPASNEAARATLEATLRDVVQDRRDKIVRLAADLASYANRLADLDQVQRELLGVTGNYSAFVDEHVLWARSSRIPTARDVAAAREAFGWLAERGRLGRLAGTVARDVREAWLGYGAFAALLLLLRASPFLVGRRFAKPGDGAALEPASAPLSRLLGSALATLSQALLLPLALMFLGWRLGIRADADDFEKALGPALTRTGVVVGVVGLLSGICRKGGLAESQFLWHGPSLRQVRRRLSVFAWIGIPVGFVYALLDSSNDPRLAQSLGRFCFLATLLLLCATGAWLKGPIRRILQPEHPTASRQRRSWLAELLVFMMTAVPVALAVLAVVGYDYTAARLAERLFNTVWLLLVLLFVKGMVERWLQHARQIEVLERVRKLREQREAAERASERGDTESGPLLADTGASQPFQANEQTRRLLVTFGGVAFLVGVWWIWKDVLPALRVLDQFVLWTHTAQAMVADAAGVFREQAVVTPVTLVDLFAALLIVALATAAARNVPGLLEITILQRLPLDASARYAALAILRYVIGIAAIVAVAGRLRIAWSDIQWLVAAITVGLGFGLQEIFANFVSGLILLFERPLRLGDVVTVNGVSGVVTRIRMRATTITDWDRKELIVPNREFITGSLLNWTLTDSVLRVVVKVGVAYGSDVERVTRLLGEVARNNPALLADPPPQAACVAFGDSSIDFELRAFVASLADLGKAQHSLHAAVERVLRENGIEIPFPQRDVRLRPSGPAAAPGAVEPETHR